MFVKNCKKSNFNNLYRDNVHRNNSGYETPRGRSLTLLHTDVIANPRNFHERVIRSLLAEDQWSLNRNDSININI